VSGPLTIADASASLRAGETTALTLVERAIAVADAFDGELGCFLKRFNDSAVASAKQIDAQLAGGQQLGPLAGIPLGIKDLISTAEAATTAQSLVLDPGWSSGDAVVVSRLREAGGVIMGKLTTMEYAIGGPDPAKPFPIPRNPWDPDRWAGGSSSGSGSSVAIGAVLGALGTDTGGSIRIPSAYCGITGLKQTFGRVPKSGCVPLGYTLDHIGPMARSARDCALLLGVLAGHHPTDLTSIDEPVPDYTANLSGDLTGVRIGVDRLAAAADKLADPALGTVLDAAIGVLRSLGADIFEVELPLYREMTVACMLLLRCEALAYHLPDMQTRWDDYSTGTRNIVGSGALFSAADYVQAQRVRRVGVKRLAELFRDVDLLLTPTLSAGAPELAQLGNEANNLSVGGVSPVHTPYWNAAGNPVLTVPVGYTADRMPLGMQLIGKPFDEALVLKAGDAYQRVTDWHMHVPPIVGEANVDGQP
jgi:aspartyl-tRNA(Asn)/glutamyl-tRNA(Gln) amidotransferase subunit A